VHTFVRVPPTEERSTTTPLEIWTNGKPEQHHSYPVAIFQVPKDIMQSSIMFYDVNRESYDRATKTDLMTTLTSICYETWMRPARKTRGRTKDAAASRWSA
jgi:mevalonate pyrophosphate decarboxylase